MSAELLASYFTFAGNTVPLRDYGPSPLDFRERVEAVARAGFTGFGIFFTDLPTNIEMIAFANIRTPDRALELVQGAGRPNGGLMLDIWHFDRGGVDMASIAKLPGERIFGVELNDSLKAVRGTLFEDTVFHRRFCGEGDFDIRGFVAGVKAAGFTGPWGVEVLSDDVRAMSVDDVARRAYATTMPFIA